MNEEQLSTDTIQRDFQSTKLISSGLDFFTLAHVL